MTAILIAAGIVTAIGLVCAVVLVLAANFFAVESDQTVSQIRECLPGANCGACGYAGCDGYAEALAADKSVSSNLCVPGGDSTAKNIADILGVEAQDVIEMVAVVHCLGDCEHTSNKMDYVGVQSCKAAASMYGGMGKCDFGCLGLGDCLAVCPNDAICFQNGVAHINPQSCVGCGLCTRACPHHLISLVDATKNVFVTCNNTEKGAVAKAKCSNACIGCKKCEKACPQNAASVLDNLARIDYSKCSNCTLCAQACPVGCIVVK